MIKIKKISCTYKNKKEPLVSLLKRPEIFLEQLKNKEVDELLALYGLEIIFAVETAIKYEGYEARENKVDWLVLPEMFSYMGPSSSLWGSCVLGSTYPPARNDPSSRRANPTPLITSSPA